MHRHKEEFRKGLKSEDKDGRFSWNGVTRRMDIWQAFYLYFFCFVLFYSRVYRAVACRIVSIEQVYSLLNYYKEIYVKSKKERINRCITESSGDI